MNTKRWGMALLIGGGVILVGGYLLAVFFDAPFILFFVASVGMISSGAETIRRARRPAAPSN